MSLNVKVATPGALSARGASANPVQHRRAMVAPGRNNGPVDVQAASKKKDVRLTVTLECTEQKEAGVPGMSRYTTEKVPHDPHEDRARRPYILRFPCWPCCCKNPLTLKTSSPNGNRTGEGSLTKTCLCLGGGGKRRNHVVDF